MKYLLALKFIFRGIALNIMAAVGVKNMDKRYDKLEQDIDKAFKEHGTIN